MRALVRKTDTSWVSVLENILKISTLQDKVGLKAFVKYFYELQGQVIFDRNDSRISTEEVNSTCK